MKKTVLFGGVLLLAGGLAVMWGRDPKPVAAAPKGNVAAGQALFSRFGCSSCHSLDGTVVVGPSLKGVTTRLSWDDIARQLREPFRGQRRMPAVKLTKAELEDLRAFLETQR
jgi:mono/diheme cytochrome c family protein